MDANYVPYSGKYTLKVSERELRCLESALLDSVSFLQSALNENTPGPLHRAAAEWIGDRQAVLNGIQGLSAHKNETPGDLP
jgi:hypothetical protein